MGARHNDEGRARIMAEVGLLRFWRAFGAALGRGVDRELAGRDFVRRGRWLAEEANVADLPTEAPANDSGAEEAA